MDHSVLDLLPGNILRTVRQWEKETGAAIYVMSAWMHPEEGPKGYEYIQAFIKPSPSSPVLIPCSCASKSCGSYISSQCAKRVRSEWYDWMKEHIG
jgi:hypothetical protein